jgi:hypothetical protein
VDKRLLTSWKRSIDAGFNKLPVQEAKHESLQINDLHLHMFSAGRGDAANSYKNSQWGISRGTRSAFCAFSAYLVAMWI